MSPLSTGDLRESFPRTFGYPLTPTPATPSTLRLKSRTTPALACRLPRPDTQSGASISDLNFQPQPRQYPPPRDTFWIDVWKIALGIFLGSRISSLFFGIVFFVATLMFAAANAPSAAPQGRAAAAARDAVAPVDNIKPMIAEYLMLAKSKAIESDKAMVAESIADAYREKGDRKAATEWDEKVKRHEAVAAAGKKIKPVK